MQSSVPSGLLPSEAPIGDLVEQAVRHCAERKREPLETALDELRCGDPDVHSTFRYALARALGGYLGGLGAAFQAVYVYGSAMRDRSSPCSDLDLLIVVHRHRDEITRLLLRLDLGLVTYYRQLLQGRAAPSSLLDIRVIDTNEAEERRGFGALLSGLETCPVCLWRFTPEVKTGTLLTGSPRRSSIASVR
ncbi:MAG: hypothetical protein NTY63_02620 [Candidatus Bipolaricaulota bacterium]|nr:hypothetical protein [Candidatus Bipolaricaulota bacterium]